MSGTEAPQRVMSERRLRILFVTPMPADPEGSGAIPVVLDAQLGALRRRHDLTVITVAGPAEADFEAVRRLSGSGVEVCAVERPPPGRRGTWRRRARMAATWLRGRRPWRTIWFAEPGVQRAIDSLLSTRRFDVVAVEDNAMGVFRLPSHVPCVLTEHEVRIPRPVDWSGLRTLGLPRWAFREAEWRRWRRYELDVWRRFDRIQVFTARDAESIRALAPALASRVRVTPFGFHLPHAAPAEPEDPRAVLFVGNFTHAPNVDAALWIGREVMPRLRARVSGVRLLVVGADPPEEVRRLAADDIEVTGTVPDVAGYFARAAVMLAPLRIGGGMRMKVLEAMARGKPVVTTARGASGLEAAGVAIPAIVAETSEELAAGAADLLRDPVRRTELGAAARDFVAEHFSAEAYARRLEATYAEVLSEARSVARARG